MAHKKSAGTSKNGRDSNPKYLGIKVTPGQFAQAGSILARQRGSSVLAGQNVSMGRDHSLFAVKDGVVMLNYKRLIHFDHKVVKKKVMHVVPV